MPYDLQEQHNILDNEIDKCYQKKNFISNEERIEILFKFYEQIINSKKLI